MNKRVNCWEYMKCGRQPGGENVASMGICPAATDENSDGLNFGKNAGRICWAVAGTFCNGKVQGTFAQKRSYCTECPFYKKVREETGSDFRMLKPKQSLEESFLE